MSRLNQQIRLPDGRAFAYDDHGPQGGQALFFLPGTPGSRHNWYMLGANELLPRLNLRVIAIDRPGMGLSDWQGKRRIGDLPADLTALADHLGLEKFAVLGYSGGGPYALACARKIPERLTKVGLVSGMGPQDAPGLTDGIHPDNLNFTRMAVEKPLLFRILNRFAAFMARVAPQRTVGQSLKTLPAADAKVVDPPEMRQIMADMLVQTMRKGARGAMHDTALMVSPWDFDPAQITMPVTLWYGDQDSNVPPAMGRYLDEALPNSTLHLYPEHGHISLLVTQAEEILAAFA